MGADVNEPRTTYLGWPFRVIYDPGHDDVAGAPVHIVAAAVLLVLALAVPGLRRSPGFVAYLAIPYGAFLLFCWFLTWQPWHVRLHMPMMCLLAPALALAFRRVLPAAAAVTAGLAALVVLYPSVRHNARPLRTMLTRGVEQVQFWYRPSLREATKQVAAFVGEARLGVIGLDVFPDDWEYPLQKWIAARSAAPPRFVEWGGELPAMPWLRPERPEIVVSCNSAAQRLSGDGSGAEFRLVAQYAPYSLFVREDLLPRVRTDRDSFTFVGWEFYDGFGPIFVEDPREQASYTAPADGGEPASIPSEPDWRPVRWSYFPKAYVAFTGDGDPVTLSVEMRPCRTAGQKVSIVLNGTKLAEHPFGRDRGFVPLRMPLETKQGLNILVFEYAIPDIDHGDNVAVMFRRLTILR
jgi:hypothetical protein